MGGDSAMEAYYQTPAGPRRLRGNVSFPDFYRLDAGQNLWQSKGKS
jgi:hypothetical protein